jgi:hypothetical protein
MNYGQALVAHACNPSYSVGRDQEDHSLKPAQANSSKDPIWKNPSEKRTGGVTQGVGPSTVGTHPRSVVPRSSKEAAVEKKLHMPRMCVRA